MEELMKSLEGPKPEEPEENELPKQVKGLLAVHIKTLEMAESEINESMLRLMQVKLDVCGHVKMFPVSSFTQDGQIICDKIKHFITELPKKNDDPANYVIVEVEMRSPLLPGRGSVLGKAALHIHDIIRESPLSGHCELKDETGVTLIVMKADFIFNYGNFGFGESLLLCHPIHKPSEYLHFSTFPRLTPVENRVDLNGITLTPHPTKYPAFIPFDRHAKLCVQENTTEMVVEHPPQLLMNKMTRLKFLHRQFKAIKDRRQRLKFLEDLIPSNANKKEQPGTNFGVTARKPRLSLVVPLS